MTFQAVEEICFHTGQFIRLPFPLRPAFYPQFLTLLGQGVSPSPPANCLDRRAKIFPRSPPLKDLSQAEDLPLGFFAPRTMRFCESHTTAAVQVSHKQRRWTCHQLHRAAQYVSPHLLQLLPTYRRGRG